VTSPLNSATRAALEDRLRFYRDLGLYDFYRRPVDPALLTAGPASAEEATDAPDREIESTGPLRVPSSRRFSGERVGEHESTPHSEQTPASNLLEEETAIPPRKTISAAPEIAAMVPAAQRTAALQLIRDEIGDCTRCALHTGRNKIVFGDGSPTARIFFVGEGPGADEDEQGLPFVGKAGQLLNNMITAMGLKREEVYIANVVKCRPPGNRTPEPDEANTCSPFLFRQIDVVRPQVLVALGATAATYLLGARQPLAGLRGRVHAYRGMSLIVTYHPAYLLRDPRQKKEAWADLQIAMKELGLKLPGK